MAEQHLQQGVALVAFRDEGNRNVGRSQTFGEELRAKGEVEKAAVRYEEALLSYLRIPALYPAQRMYLPQATYGAAQAYLGIQDFDRARTAIKELKLLFAATPEAKSTDALSEKLEKRAALLTTPEPKK